jgi:hypothetical protein
MQVRRQRCCPAPHCTIRKRAHVPICSVAEWSRGRHAGDWAMRCITGCSEVRSAASCSPAGVSACMRWLPAGAPMVPSQPRAPAPEGWRCRAAWAAGGCRCSNPLGNGSSRRRISNSAADVGRSSSGRSSSYMPQVRQRWQQRQRWRQRWRQRQRQRWQQRGQQQQSALTPLTCARGLGCLPTPSCPTPAWGPWSP